MSDTGQAAETDEASRPDNPSTKWLARQGITVCTECGNERETKDVLAVRRVYQEIIDKKRTVRSRTVGKVCRSCLKQDEVFNSDKKFN